MAEFLRSIQDSDGPAAAAEPEGRLPVYDSPLAPPRGGSLPGSEFPEFLGGAIAIDNNLTRGTVVTLTVGAESPKASPQVLERPSRPEPTPRQKKVLLLIAELGSAGPSAIAKELAVSQSTAYRELHLLARWRLVDSKGGGKRTLTAEGIAVLGEVFKP